MVDFVFVIEYEERGPAGTLNTLLFCALYRSSGTVEHSNNGFRSSFRGGKAEHFTASLISLISISRLRTWVRSCERPTPLSSTLSELFSSTLTAVRVRLSFE
jgi:hypothetical protein